MIIKENQRRITIWLLITVLIIALWINTPEKSITPEPERFSNNLISSFPPQELDNFLKNSSIELLFGRPIHHYDPVLHCSFNTPQRQICKCPYGSIEYDSEPEFNPPQGGYCLPPLCLYVKSYSYAGSDDLFISPNHGACATAVFFDSPQLCEQIPPSERDYCYLSLKQYTGNATFCEYVTSKDYKQLCAGTQHD